MTSHHKMSNIFNKLINVLIKFPYLNEPLFQYLRLILNI